MGGPCLNTLVQVCKGEIKTVTPRDRVAAANALLDRGFGKPVQAMEMTLFDKKLTELSVAELQELRERFVSIEASQGEAKVIH